MYDWNAPDTIPPPRPNFFNPSRSGGISTSHATATQPISFSTPDAISTPSSPETAPTYLHQQMQRVTYRPESSTFGPSLHPNPQKPNALEPNQLHIAPDFNCIPAEPGSADMAPRAKNAKNGNNKKRALGEDAYDHEDEAYVPNTPVVVKDQRMVSGYEDDYAGTPSKRIRTYPDYRDKSSTERAAIEDHGKAISSTKQPHPLGKPTTKGRSKTPNIEGSTTRRSSAKSRKKPQTTSISIGTVNPGSGEQGTIFNCDFEGCDKSYKQAFGLRRHVDNKHPNHFEKSKSSKLATKRTTNGDSKEAKQIIDMTEDYNDQVYSHARNQKLKTYSSQETPVVIDSSNESDVEDFAEGQNLALPSHNSSLAFTPIDKIEADTKYSEPVFSPRNVIPRNICLPPFNDGDVYIQLIPKRKDYSYYLDRKKLCEISPWFEKTLRLNVPEANESLAAKLKNSMKCKVRYELKFKPEINFWIPERVSFTKVKDEIDGDVLTRNEIFTRLATSDPSLYAIRSSDDHGETDDLANPVFIENCLATRSPTQARRGISGNPHMGFGSMDGADDLDFDFQINEHSVQPASFSGIRDPAVSALTDGLQSSNTSGSFDEGDITWYNNLVQLEGDNPVAPKEPTLPLGSHEQLVRTDKRTADPNNANYLSEQAYTSLEPSTVSQYRKPLSPSHELNPLFRGDEPFLDPATGVSEISGEEIFESAVDISTGPESHSHSAQLNSQTIEAKPDDCFVSTASEKPSRAQSTKTRAELSTTELHPAQNGLTQYDTTQHEIVRAGVAQSSIVQYNIVQSATSSLIADQVAMEEEIPSAPSQPSSHIFDIGPEDHLVAITKEERFRTYSPEIKPEFHIPESHNAQDSVTQFDTSQHEIVQTDVIQHDIDITQPATTQFGISQSAIEQGDLSNPAQPVSHVMLSSAHSAEIKLETPIADTLIAQYDIVEADTSQFDITQSDAARPNIAQLDTTELDVPQPVYQKPLTLVDPYIQKPIALDAVTITTKEAILAYRNIFRIAYGLAPELDKIDINAAFRSIKVLFQAAGSIGCSRIVRSKCREHIFDYFGRHFLLSIQEDPARWLEFALVTRSAFIFKEAMVHLIGQHPYWPWKSMTQEELKQNAPEVSKLIEAKSNEIRCIKTEIDLRLYESTLSVGNVPLSSGPNHKEVHDAWLVVQYWQDWFRRSLALSDKRYMDARPYHIMATGGDDYLPLDDVHRQLKHFRGVEVYGKRETKNELGLMKRYAMEQVERLVVNQSLLPVKEMGIGYFTCAAITTEELPWYDMGKNT